jgi:hypothetical protein
VSIDGRKVPNFLAANLEGMEALLAHAMPAMPSPPGCSFLLCGALTAINFSRSLPLSSSSSVTPHQASFSNPCPAASRLFPFAPNLGGFHQMVSGVPLLALEAWHSATAARANSGSG